MPQKGLKMGSFHPFVHPKWSRMRFGKMRFGPIFDPFLVPKQPIFKAFWDFRRTKMGHHKLRTVQKHLFQRRTWSRIIFEKSHLFAPTGPC